MPPRSNRSNNRQNATGAASWFTKKNAPIIGSVILLGFGVLLAIMPASRPSPAARAGFQQAEKPGQHPPQLQQAVEAIHAARDKVDFTAEVMLSIVNRFYRVLLGGPSSVNSTTEWSKLSGSVFRVYGFAVDDASSAVAKNDRSPGFKKAVADQIMSEAHIHMIARTGDTIFVDPETQFGGEYLSERCNAFTSYGMKCAAWDDARIADAISELVADQTAFNEQNGGELAPAGTDARKQLFLIGRSKHLNSVGMWPDDSSREPHPLQPLHQVPHLILIPGGEDHLREQQEQQERYMKARAAAAAAAQKEGKEGGAGGAAAPAAGADQDRDDEESLEDK